MGVGDSVSQIPVLIVEPENGIRPMSEADRTKLFEELLQLGKGEDFTSRISRFLLISEFPVDIRHNAKIFREKLAVWAESFDLDKACVTPSD